MAISRRQTGYNEGQGQELIVQPQKVAYEISSLLEKEFNSFEAVTHSQNLMRNLLNYKFVFEPSFFQLFNPLNYKAANTILEAEEFLPSLKIDAKMAKKINTLIQDGLNSTFFLTGSSFEPSSHDLGNQTFFLDKASFDFEDSFEKQCSEKQIKLQRLKKQQDYFKFELALLLHISLKYQGIVEKDLEIVRQFIKQKYDMIHKILTQLSIIGNNTNGFILFQINRALYGRKEYSVSCFCIGDSSRNIKPSRLIMEQVKETVKGLSSFKGMEVSYLSEYQYRRTDLLYLNHFRIFLFFSDQGEGVKIQRYIFYPRVNFSTQLISQPFRFVSTPLTSFLAQKTKNINISLAEIAKRKNTVRYGFLGLDSTQRMLPLCASDDYCVSNPLIGVWTYGINYTENSDCDYESRRFVWSLLAEFSKNTTIAQRFSFDQERKSFILAVFNLDESAKYFEVCLLPSENEDIHSDNTSEGIMCSWCMLKNYQVVDQQQGSKKYNQPQDSSVRLTQELPFRFSPKMVVDHFDDQEFCQPQEEPRNKQTHVKQQSSKRLSNFEAGSNNINDKSNETVKMIANRVQKRTSSQSQENQSSQLQQAGKTFENMQTSKQALKTQIEILQKEEEMSMKDNFIQANNQTFSQNSNPELKLAQNEQPNNGLPKAAEKIIKQQQEQIDQMKEQIQQLTNALMTVKQQQSQQSQMSQSYVHQTQNPISQSQILTNQSQQIMYPPQRYPHPQQQMLPPNQHPQHYPPYPFQGYYPPGYMFDPYNQQQYYPFPPPGSIQEPYGMYPRGQGYSMHESIISGDGKSNRSVDSIHLANKKYQEGNHKRHMNPSNASDFVMSEVQSVRNNYEDQQSVKNKDEEAENESFKQLNFAPFHAQINFMKAKQQVQSIPDEHMSFAQNSFAGGFNQQHQDSFEQQNQQQVTEEQTGKEIIPMQQMKEQQLTQKQSQAGIQEQILNNAKESKQINFNNHEEKYNSFQEDDDVQEQQYQVQQYQPKTTASEEPRDVDSKYSPVSFIAKNTPTSLQTLSAQSQNKEPIQTRETSQFKANPIDQKKQLELAREAARLASLESEETFTMDEHSHPKMNLDFLNSVRKSDEPSSNFNFKGNTKTGSMKGNDQRGEIPTINCHDYQFDSDSDDEIKVIQKKYNIRD